jgi:hypothetical protein
MAFGTIFEVTFRALFPGGRCTICFQGTWIIYVIISFPIDVFHFPVSNLCAQFHKHLGVKILRLLRGFNGIETFLKCIHFHFSPFAAPISLLNIVAEALQQLPDVGELSNLHNLTDFELNEVSHKFGTLDSVSQHLGLVLPANALALLFNLIVDQLTSSVLKIPRVGSRWSSCRVHDALYSARIEVLRTACANIEGINRSRDAKSQPQPVLYFSSSFAAVISLDRMALDLHLNREKNFRVIPVSSTAAALGVEIVGVVGMDIDALRSAYEQDIRNGLSPCGVVINIGTELSESDNFYSDNVSELSRFCLSQKLWLHAEVASSLFLASCHLQKRYY